MKKFILIILLFPSISSYAQDVYQYESSKKKMLLNIADSSEIILNKKTKNRPPYHQQQKRICGVQGKARLAH